jgi:type IV pilus assembly protein PilF
MIRTIALLLTAVLYACTTTTEKGSSKAGVVAQDAVNRARAHMELGLGYYENGQYQYAIEELGEAIKAKSDYVPAYDGLGLVYMQLKEDKKAEENFRKAIRYDPQYSSAKNNFGQFLCSRGRNEEGLRYLLEAVKNPLYDTPDIAYKNAGVCAKRAGDIQAAEEYFRQAVLRNPRQGQALFNLADLNYQKRNNSQAKVYADRLIQLATPGPEVLWLAARIERRLGDNDTALKYADQLRRRFPDAPETRATTTTDNGVGAQLAQARQAQGLSLGEMARQLKLSVKQVEALERDDYSNFPGPLWARGFLRNYAKSLGIDADALVERAGLAVDTLGSAPAAAGTPLPADAARERRRTVVLTFAFVILGLFVLGLLGQRAGKDHPNPPMPVTSKNPANPPIATPSLPGAPEVQQFAPIVPKPGDGAVNAQPSATPQINPQATPEHLSESATTPPAPSNATSGQATTPISAPNTSSTTQATVSAAPSVISSAPTPAPSMPSTAASTQATVKEAEAKPAPQLEGSTTATAAAAPPVSTQSASAPVPSNPPPETSPPPKPRTLRFTFTQSVWVEVKDANNEVLLSKLQAAGTHKAVRGMPPFSVAVGNVHAVTLIYRGREVDLVSRAKNGQAKVILK